MNNSRRKELRVAIGLLCEAQRIVENVLDEEGDSLDNVPENLQESDRYEKISDCVDTLEDIFNGIGDTLDMIYDVCN